MIVGSNCFLFILFTVHGRCLYPAWLGAQEHVHVATGSSGPSWCGRYWEVLKTHDRLVWGTSTIEAEASHTLTILDVQLLAKYGVVKDVDSMTEYLLSVRGSWKRCHFGLITEIAARGEHFFHHAICPATDLYGSSSCKSQLTLQQLLPVLALLLRLQGLLL